MKLRPFIVLLLSGTVLLTLLGSSPVSAQWRGIRSPAQMVLRNLGHGFGPGYHSRTPGPNSDYYNPYSAHNSMLISQMGPQPQTSRYLEGNRPHWAVVDDSIDSTNNRSGGDFQLPPPSILDNKPSKSENSGDADSSESTGENESNDPTEGQRPADDSSVQHDATKRSLRNENTPPKPVGYSKPNPTDSETDWSLVDRFPDNTDR